jgi:hypothetical protein
MIYRAVKLVTTLRPNLGFFPRTPAPLAGASELTLGLQDSAVACCATEAAEQAAVWRAQ